MKFGLAAALVCAATAIFFQGTAHAAPVTLDFESFPNPPGGSGIVSHGNTIVENGFVLSTNAAFGGFASYSSSSIFYTGSVAMFANQANGSVVLTQDGGGAFSIESIALATTNLLPSGNPLVITGVRSDTSIVQQAFSYGATIEVYSFTSGFTDLVSLSWTQDPSNNVQFDNIVVDNAPVAVPVAGQAMLMLLCAPLLLRARRRRRGSVPGSYA